MVSDDQETPRTLKRRRDELENLTFHFSSIPSCRSESGTFAVASHKSERLSPVKQMHALNDLERPVIFYDVNSERANVAMIHATIQLLADGIGILECDNVDLFNASVAEPPSSG